MRRHKALRFLSHAMKCQWLLEWLEIQLIWVQVCLAYHCSHYGICKFWFMRASNEPCIEKYKTRACWEFTHIAGSCFIFFYIRRMPRISLEETMLCIGWGSKHQRAKSQLFCNWLLQACRHGSSFLSIQAKSYVKVRKNGEFSLEILSIQAKWHAKVREMINSTKKRTSSKHDASFIHVESM